MAEVKEKSNSVKTLVKKSVGRIDADKVREKATATKEAALETKDKVNNKIHALDIKLENAIIEYNVQYSALSEMGMNLYMQRTRAVDVVGNVEELLNSIANKPLSLDSDFEEINKTKTVFKDAESFAKEEVQNIQKSAMSMSVGVTAGAAVMELAPSAAMWVATTFGTASTGTAISSLSGAAATNAALAWLGGGTIASGASGIVGGEAFLALAGPVGIGLAGASILFSIVLFSKNKIKNTKTKNMEIESVKKNTATLKKKTEDIRLILAETVTLRDSVAKMFTDSMYLSEKEYNTFSDEEKMKIGTLINNTKALSALFAKTVQ